VKNPYKLSRIPTHDRSARCLWPLSAAVINLPSLKNSACCVLCACVIYANPSGLQAFVCDVLHSGHACLACARRLPDAPHVFLAGAQKRITTLSRLSLAPYHSKLHTDTMSTTRPCIDCNTSVASAPYHAVCRSQGSSLCCHSVAHTCVWSVAVTLHRHCATHHQYHSHPSRT
jgi:hypothetical protein